ncbi:hypothetical protein GCM10020255_019970 [Rhodococcus baikonurensis]
MIVPMDTTNWHATQTTLLCEILQDRNIVVRRDVVEAFVSNMLTLVAETAGISEHAASETITEAAAERWADSLAPTILAMENPCDGTASGVVLVSAHTRANRRNAHRVGTRGRLGRGVHRVGQPGDGRLRRRSRNASGTALDARQRVQELSLELARHLVTQPPMEMLQIPVQTHALLCDLLDQLSQSELLPIAENNGHGTYHHTVDGEYTLGDVVAATLHDLDVASTY